MDHVNHLETAPLFAPRDYEAPALFTPQNLLREARRQKGLADGHVPAICVFDPDGDLVDFLHATGRACHLRCIIIPVLHRRRGGSCCKYRPMFGNDAVTKVAIGYPIQRCTYALSSLVVRA